jgi:hypothetical protein
MAQIEGIDLVGADAACAYGSHLDAQFLEIFRQESAVPAAADNGAANPFVGTRDLRSGHCTREKGFQAGIFEACLMNRTNIT